MAYRKVSDSSLQGVAGAILNKTGGQNALQFPEDFISAIQSIATGGSFPPLPNPAGSGQILENYSAYSHDGSVVNGGIVTKTSSGNFIITPSTPNYAKSFDAGYYPNAHGHYVDVDTTKQNITLESVPKEIPADSGKFMTRAVITGLGGDLYHVETGIKEVASAAASVSVTGLSFTPRFAVIYMVAQKSSTLKRMICFGNTAYENGNDTWYGIARYKTASDGLNNVATNQVSFGSNSVTFLATSSPDRDLLGVYRYVIWGR